MISTTIDKTPNQLFSIATETLKMWCSALTTTSGSLYKLNCQTRWATYCHGNSAKFWDAFHNFGSATAWLSQCYYGFQRDKTTEKVGQLAGLVFGETPVFSQTQKAQLKCVRKKQEIFRKKKERKKLGRDLSECEPFWHCRHFILISDMGWHPGISMSSHPKKSVMGAIWKLSMKACGAVGAKDRDRKKDWGNGE